MTNVLPKLAIAPAVDAVQLAISQSITDSGWQALALVVVEIPRRQPSNTHRRTRQLVTLPDHASPAPRVVAVCVHLMRSRIQPDPDPVNSATLLVADVRIGRVPLVLVNVIGPVVVSPDADMVTVLVTV